MPTHPVPDNAVSYLSKLEARVRALESTPPMGMTNIVHNPIGSASGLGPTSVSVDAAGTRSDFTLIRPVPLFIVGVLDQTLLTQASGSCPFCTLNLAICNGTTSNVVAQDVNGVNMVSATQTIWPNDGDGRPAFQMMSVVCPAGQYYVAWRYLMGPPIAGALFGYNDGEIDIFQLSG